jgi:hypothetical protein
MRPARHLTAMAFRSRRRLLLTQTARQRWLQLARWRDLRRSHGTAAVLRQIVDGLIIANDAGNRRRRLL